MQYYELPKLPMAVGADDALGLWLKLFDAETEEDLRRIEEMGVPVMKQAIGAYRSVTATEEFRALERMRSDARHNEASALANARREAADETDAKWQGVVAEKDAALVKKDAALAEKDAEIARLRAMLGESK